MWTSRQFTRFARWTSMSISKWTPTTNWNWFVVFVPWPEYWQSKKTSGRRTKIKKKDKRVWVREWVKRRETDGFYAKLMEELEDVPQLYRNFLRMTKNDFEHLLAIVEPMISKMDFKLRDAISFFFWRSLGAYIAVPGHRRSVQVAAIRVPYLAVNHQQHHPRGVCSYIHGPSQRIFEGDWKISGFGKLSFSSKFIVRSTELIDAKQAGGMVGHPQRVQQPMEFPKLHRGCWRETCYNECAAKRR